MRWNMFLTAVPFLSARASDACAGRGGAGLIGDNEDWAMGPFVKQKEPILEPTPNLTFQCPVLGKTVRWEEQNVYNPAAVVRDGKVYLLYRADDCNRDLAWGRTCRIGLASSEDGRRFTRHPEPVLYPDNDPWKKYEWEGGCEDLHVIEGQDRQYYMNYTTWDGRRDTMSVATSSDLVHWTKHGPAFRKHAPDAVYGSRTGVVVSRLAEDGKLLPAKIDGQYWMYYTHPSALAASDNLIDWKPTGRSVWPSGGHESGAAALLRDDGILLMFNGAPWGDVSIPGGAWTLGQALIDPKDRLTVLKHGGRPFIFPEREWEKKGFCPAPATVANGLVCFKGEWLLYYGAADRVIALAVCRPQSGPPFCPPRAKRNSAVTLGGPRHERKTDMDSRGFCIDPSPDFQRLEKALRRDGEPDRAPVHVARKEDIVEIDNGLVKARFTQVKDGVQQEYLTRRGKEWVLLAESFRPRQGGTASVSPLYDTSIDPAHRFLAGEVLQKIVSADTAGESAQVVLQGKCGETTIEQTVDLRRGQRFVHIEVKATLSGSPPKLEYLLAPLVVALDGKLDATHAPTYKPTADSVIGDREFSAPVVCVQQGGLFAGLAPDLDIINRHVVYAKGARQHPDSNSFPVPVDPANISMPTALDLELPSSTNSRPVLSYGMMDYIVHQHVWFQHLSAPGAMVRELSNNEVRIGMDLLLSTDAPKCRGYQMAAQHLWRRFGSEHFRRPRPQAMPNAEYAKVCYPANFQYQGYDVAGERLNHRQLPDRPDMRAWQQWEVDGHPVGGLRLYAPQWYNLITNLAWWNNACDATGFYYWGEQLDDKDLLDKARRMVNLALSAPQNQGLFPAIYDLGGKRWLRSLWNPPLNGYNPDARSAYWDSNTGGVYQTAAASVTAGYLLQYRRTCEDNPRILPYVRRYGDFLLANMPPNGCVPGWFTADLKPLPSLKWNADGGAHVWVLSELYLATKEQKHLDGARQAAKFLLDEVMPQQRWADFEALYSCAIKPETFFDARTGQWPCDTMSISWALQGFLALHEATQDKQCLDAAAAVADFAALFQAVWAPHYIITAYPFGGLSSQLGDGEWLDQRAHRFADPFVRIGLLTGRQDLVERGIAAARSSLTLANHPRHQANGIYTHTDFPIGLGPENIDHEGFPQRPLSSGPSWNSVGGLAGMAHVMNRLGGAYVDFSKNLAAGVDGLKIVSFHRKGRTIRLKVENQLAALPMPYDHPYAVEVRMVGLPAGEYKLIINDGPAQRIDAARLAHYTVEVNDNNS